MINQSYLNWYCRFGLSISLSFITNLSALAQVIPDQTLGTEVTDIGLGSYISGGTTVGNTNLFHSFSTFSVPNGGGAIFINDSSISNIFARVTGGTASNIQGLIYAQGAANLFLMNPNGIIFGNNAQLNISGSFVATTANAIQFPGGAEFSLTSPVTPNNSLLSVNPTAFLFNQIANQGANSIENRAILAVPNNKSLILLGGRISPTPESTGQVLIDGGQLAALDGRVEIGGLTAPGIVGLNVNDNNFSLSFPDRVAKTDISLVNQSVAIATGAGGGDIVVNANNLNLENSSYFFTGINQNQGTSDTKAGDIVVNASGVVTLNENSVFGNIALGIGDSGNINVSARSLKMNSSSIQAIATEGNSGIVNIKVEDTVSLSGTNANGFGSLIASAVQPRDTSISREQTFSGTPTYGRSGGIDIQGRNLLLTDGALISATNIFANDSGDIKIQAFDTINLNNFAAILSLSSDGKGKAGNLSITTNYLNLQNQSQISANTLGGNGGDISIAAQSISLDNSFISASANSSPEVLSNVGDAGNINIQTGTITLTNYGTILSVSGEPEPGETIGRGGDINITATDLIEIDPKGSTDRITGISATTFSSSRAGDVTLNTKNLLVKNGGYITVGAVNNLGGDAGNITINASDSVDLISSNTNFRSLISTQVKPVGNGGDITINTKRLQLTNGTISAGTFGKGNAGDIFITSNDGVVVDNGIIDSRVGAGGVGNAGDIKIQTRKLSLTNGGAISTLIAEATENLPGGQGKGGSIRIDAADAVTISGTNINGNASGISSETQSGALGQGGDIIINTDYFRLTDNAFVSAGTGNSSNSGNITFNTRVFEASNGGLITTGTVGSGKSGDITINAADSITISTNSNNITGLFAGTSSTGNGGTIFLSTTNFNLFTSDLNLPNNVAGVSTRSNARGVAGNINITAKGNFRVSNSFVNAQSEQAGGGSINITAKNIRLLNNSDIRTDLSTGEGSGGNITLNANTIIALEDSDILAFAPEGQGGNITFNTRALLTSPLYRPTQTSTDANTLQSLNNNNRTDINASGAISGNIIGVPDITFIQNSITELQSNPIDTNALIANSCIARNPRQEGTFLIEGAGGLPARPGNALASTYATGDVQNISNQNVTHQWKKGDSIVEPQGVYRLANGQLVMSRECG